MSNSPVQPNGVPSTIAVLHRHGGQWFGLIASIAEGFVRVLDTRAFTGGSDPAMNRWLDDRQVGRVLCVLPASSIICRTVTLPAASAEQMDEALRLQAEAHLLGIAPPHRQAMAVLPAAAGETTRSGLVIAWPQSRSIEIPDFNRPVTCTADIAALAALTNGQRPAQPLIWLDPAANALAIALAHANGMVLRALNADLSDAAQRADAVRRTLAETALNVGHTGPFIESIVQQAQAAVAAAGDQRVLLLPAEIRDAAAERLTGVTPDDEWWARFGIAAGALLALAGPLAPLAMLLPSVPIASPSRVREVVERLSNRRVAIAAAFACAIVLVFGPLFVHGLRVAVLSMRYPDIEQDVRLVDRLEDQREMYMELKDRGWSVTKVLSDIACNTPLDIEVEHIRISSSDRGFSIMGKALSNAKENISAPDVVAGMQKNLHESGVFKDVKVTIEKPDFSGRYSFDLTATVSRPFHRFDYRRLSPKLDFALLTHLERMQGKTVEEKLAAAGDAAKGAAATSVAAGSAAGDSARDEVPMRVAGADEIESTDAGADGGTSPGEIVASSDGASSPLSRSTPPRSSPGSTRPMPNRSFGSQGGSGEEPRAFSDQDRRSEGSLTAPSATIPDALTEAQINAMTREQALSALTNISNARLHATLTDEQSERLKNENRLLLQRLSALKQGG